MQDFLKVLKTMCINVEKSFSHPSISTLRPVISSNIPVENNYKTFQNFFSIENATCIQFGAISIV